MFGFVSTLLKPNTQWLEQKQNTILSAATIITVANIISALSGILRQRLLISFFFDTPASRDAFDAFLIAFQIPDMMFQLIIIGALSAAFIPIFTTHKKHNAQEAFQMSSIMMNILLLFFIIVGAIIAYFAYPITEFRTGPDFSPEQVTIAAKLTQVMILAQFFFAISNFMTGILQSYQRFILPSLAPVLYNIGIVVGVWLFHAQFGIYSAGMGVVMGAFLHMLIQVPLVMKLGFRYKLSFNIRYKGIKEFFTIMPPRIISLSVGEFRKLALGFFATSLGNWSFTVMQLGLMLMAMPIRFFGVPISQASLPFLSEEAGEEDRDRFKHLVLQSLHQIAFLTYPLSVLILILRVPIVRIVFGTKDFPWTTTISIGQVLQIVAISIAAQAMVHLLVRAFYALKDTKTPLIVSVLDMVLYVGLSYYFVYKTSFGVMGIAAATSISAIVEFLALLLLLDLKVKGFARERFWVPQIKMIVTSFFMAVFLYLPFKILDELVFETTKTIELLGLTITTSTIGMLVYLYFAALFDVRELAIIMKLFKQFEGWQRTLQRSEEVLVETHAEGDEV